MSFEIDLNADVGELPGPEGRHSDAQILRVVTSCNIACGGHAGDERMMRHTIRNARVHQVSIGAHPSYPDRENFGRVAMDIERDALMEALTAQCSALASIAAEEGAEIHHLKPHGALYNSAATDAELADLIVEVSLNGGIGRLFGPPNSALQAAAESAGLDFVAEGFADRAYEADGTLVSRQNAGAIIAEKAEQGRRAVQMATQFSVVAKNADLLPLPVQTICLHGDGPNAAQSARAISAALINAGVDISAPLASLSRA